MNENSRNNVWHTSSVSRRYSNGDVDDFVDICLKCSDLSSEHPCRHVPNRGFNRFNSDFDASRKDERSEIVKSARSGISGFHSDKINSTSRKNELNTDKASRKIDESSSEDETYKPLPKLAIEDVNSTSIRKLQVRRMSELIKMHGIREDDSDDSDRHRFRIDRDDDDEDDDSVEDNEWNGSGRKPYQRKPMAIHDDSYVKQSSRLNESDGHPDDRRGNKMSEEGRWTVETIFIRSERNFVINSEKFY